jgi:GT2 family glycosyltransferase
MVIVASSTRQPTEADFFEKTWLGRSLSRLDEKSFKPVLALGRKDGLSKFYNEVIAEYHEAPAIVTIHDDMCIADLWFFEKILLAVDEFDVVGLCGCRTPKDEAHTAWFSAAHNPSGQIATSMRPTDEAVLSSALVHFGPTPARSASMDGVMLAFKPEKLGAHRFDERFQYHHYDIDFTLSADKRGLKVGTWPIFTIHASCSGDGYQSRSFRESTEIFSDKWAKANA